MNHLHDVDPFNHGTTSITYQELLDDIPPEFANALKQGWGITPEGFAHLVVDGTIIENNFRAQTENGTYLFKQLKPKDIRMQSLIHRTMDYLRSEGIRMPCVLSTSTGETIYRQGKEIFCMHEFIDGEYYDGSRQELITIATQTALFHRALAKLPFEQEFPKRTGDHMRHNADALQRLLASESCAAIPESIGGTIQEIRDESRRVMSANIQGLSRQIIHDDLHPYNTLWNPVTKEFVSWLDLEIAIHSQTIRDTGFAMHRFARTCGAQTERKQDVGASVQHRARVFLHTYLKEYQLTDKDIRALPIVLQDETLWRIRKVLEYYEEEPNELWIPELAKHLTMLREGQQLSL